MPRTGTTALSPAQLEILGVLWERGEEGISGIAEALSKRRKVSRPTVMIQVLRLEKRGFLKRRREGNSFRYRAVGSRDEVIGTLADQIVNSACGGSTEYLIKALFDRRGLSASEAQRLRRMIEEHRKGPER